MDLYTKTQGVFVKTIWQPQRTSHLDLSQLLRVAGSIAIPLISSGVFPPYLIISTHFLFPFIAGAFCSVCLHITPSSALLVDIYYPSLCPHHPLTLSLSRSPVICALPHQRSRRSPHLPRPNSHLICGTMPYVHHFLPFLPGHRSFSISAPWLGAFLDPPACPKLQMGLQTSVPEFVLTAPSHIFTCHL